jgi:hypothetical protein
MMKLTRVAAAAVAALGLASVLTAQEFPKAGPEHDLLKMDVGTWDAEVEAFGPPGAPPAGSKGSETSRMTAGGRYLVTDFKSDIMGMPFEGHGIFGYDAAKKKYVGTWVDSMSGAPSTSEASYDAAKKTMTGTMEGPDPMGRIVKTKAVTEYKDPNTRVFTLYNLEGGKETVSLRITYKRRP